jgi:hypothetical protein
MLRRFLLGAALLAGVLLLGGRAVIAGDGEGDGAKPEPPPDPTAEVRAKIVALDADGAKGALAAYKAANKTPEGKKTAADLEREVASVKKVEPVAAKILKLLDDAKPREAYATGWALADQIPGAIALAAIRPRVLEARKLAFQPIDDFDAADGGLKWTPHGSKMERVPDPLGGKALHWTASAGKGKTFLDAKLPEKLDLAPFEALTLRLRATRRHAGTLDVGFDLEARNNAGITPPFKLEPDGKWHEVRAPLDALEKGRGFDAAQVAWVILYYKGADDIDLSVDEMNLTRRKAAK